MEDAEDTRLLFVRTTEGTEDTEAKRQLVIPAEASLASQLPSPPSIFA
jgi:hypothetical protein